MEASYTVMSVSQVWERTPHMMRDLNDQNKPFCILRTSGSRTKVWSFHGSEALAKAAARRWRAREVVTH